MAEFNEDIDLSRSATWVQEVEAGFIVVVELISLTGEIQQFGTEPFPTYEEAECYWLRLQGREA